MFRGILAWAGLGAFCFFAERVRIFLFVPVLEIGAIPGGNCPSEVNAPPVRTMPHVAGYQVTADVVYRLADGVDPSVITAAESAAGSVPGVLHAHARARWTGRRLRVEIEGWVDPGLPVRDADAVGRQVAAALARRLPEAGSLTWMSRAGPAGDPALSAAAVSPSKAVSTYEAGAPPG